MLPECPGEVVLDGGDQVRYGETGCQPSREFVEVLNLPLTLVQGFGFESQPRRKVAADQRDQQEQQQVDDGLRFVEPEAVIGWEKEEIRRRRASNRGYDGRPGTPPRRGDEHRYQVHDRNEVSRNEAVSQEKSARRQSHEQQGHGQRQGVCQQEAMQRKFLAWQRGIASFGSDRKPRPLSRTSGTRGIGTPRVFLRCQEASDNRHHNDPGQAALLTTPRRDAQNQI